MSDYRLHSGLFDQIGHGAHHAVIFTNEEKEFAHGVILHHVDKGYGYNKMTKQEAMQVLSKKGIPWQSTFAQLLEDCNQLRARIGRILHAFTLGFVGTKGKDIAIELTLEQLFPHKHPQGLGSKKDTRQQRISESWGQFEEAWMRLNTCDLGTEVQTAVEDYQQQAYQYNPGVTERDVCLENQTKIAKKDNARRRMTEECGLAPPISLSVLREPESQFVTALQTEFQPWLLKNRAAVASIDPQVHPWPPWQSTGEEWFTLARFLAGLCESTPLRLAIDSPKMQLTDEAELRKSWLGDSYDGSGPIIVANVAHGVLSALLTCNPVVLPKVSDSFAEMEEVLSALQLSSEHCTSMLMAAALARMCEAILCTMDDTRRKCDLVITQMKHTLNQQLASLSHHHGELDMQIESHASNADQFGESPNIELPLKRVKLSEARAKAATVSGLIEFLNSKPAGNVGIKQVWGGYVGWMDDLNQHHRSLSLEPTKAKISVVKHLAQLHNCQHNQVKDTVSDMRNRATDMLVTLKKNVIRLMDRVQLVGTLIVNKVRLSAQAAQGELSILREQARVLSPKQLASGFSDTGLPRLANLAFDAMIMPSETLKHLKAEVRIFTPQLVADPNVRHAPVLRSGADVLDGVTMQRCSKLRLVVNSGIVAKTSHLEISFMCCPMCQFEVGTTLTFSPNGCSVAHMGGGDCEASCQLEFIHIDETSFDPQSYYADDRQKLLDEQAKYRFAEAVGGMGAVGIIDFCSSPGQNRDIRGLAEAVIAKCGKQMAKLDCGDDQICMIGDQRKLWCMHQPKKRSSAGADSGYPVPTSLIEAVKAALMDEFHRAQAPFNARNLKAMQNTVTTYILAHAGQPGLDTNNCSVNVDGFSMKDFDTESDLLAEKDSADRWGNKSPLDRAGHLTGEVDAMTRSIATSLSETGVGGVRNVASHVAKKLWQLVPKQNSAAYMLHSNPQWTVGVQGAGGGLELLDLRKGIERRPLELADRHTAYLRIQLPSNFEELVRSFPFDTIRTLDRHGVTESRWSIEEQAKIQAWCDLFPTKQEASTAWETIAGRSNQFARGGYMDYCTAYSISLLGVDKASVLVLLKGLNDANGEAEANTGKTAIFAAHGHIHGGKNVPDSHAASVTCEVLEDQKMDALAANPVVVSLRFKRSAYVDESKANLRVSARQVATLVPHGPAQTILARDLFETAIAMRLAVTIWIAFNAIPSGIGTTSVNKRAYFLGLVAVVTETQESYDALASGNEAQIEGPVVTPRERNAFKRHGKDALLPPNEHFDATSGSPLFKAMSQMDAVIALIHAAYVRLDLNGEFPPPCEYNAKLRSDEMVNEAVTNRLAHTDIEEAVAQIFLREAQSAPGKAIAGAKALAKVQTIFDNGRAGNKSFAEAINERREELKGEEPKAKKATKTQAFVDILHEGLKKIHSAGSSEVHVFDPVTSASVVYVGPGLSNMVCPIKGYEWNHV